MYPAAITFRMINWSSSNCGFDPAAHPNTLPIAGYDFIGAPQCFTPVPAGSPILGSLEDTSTGLRYERRYTLFVCDEATPDDRRYCGTSNIGGGFWASGQEFVGKLGTHPNSFRQESLWVVILLTDGVANHANNVGLLPCWARLQSQSILVPGLPKWSRHPPLSNGRRPALHWLCGALQCLHFGASRRRRRRRRCEPLRRG